MRWGVLTQTKVEVTSMRALLLFYLYWHVLIYRCIGIRSALIIMCKTVNIGTTKIVSL